MFITLQVIARNALHNFLHKTVIPAGIDISIYIYVLQNRQVTGFHLCSVIRVLTYPVIRMKMFSMESEIEKIYIKLRT